MTLSADSPFPIATTNGHIRRFGLLILGGFVVSTVLLGVIAYFVNRGIRELVGQNERVSHTYEVLGVLDDTLSHHQDVQIALLRYIVTDQPDYLADYYRLRGQIPRDCERLRSLIPDNAEQQERLTQLERHFQIRLTATSELLDIFHEEGLAAAQADVRSGTGKQAALNVRQTITTMVAEELRLLGERQQASALAAHELLRAAAAGLATVLVISGVLFLFVRREGVRRKYSEASLKLANERLEQSLADTRSTTRETAAIAAMGDFIQTCRSPKEAYAVMTRIVPKLLPGVTGAVGIISNSRNLVETVFTWGEKGTFASEFTPEECWGLRRGRAHYVMDAEGCDPTCGHVGPEATGYLCLPMVIHGETLGVLSLRAHGSDAISDRERRVARAVAEQVSLALANLRLQEALRFQSIRDPLTGLFNRRYLEESLEREIGRAQRHGQPVAVIMIDLDHFKQFNDSHGHEGGDALLAEFGKLLTSKVRTEDIPCRFGGEEFCLVMPGADLGIAQSRAEDLREAVKKLSVTCRRRPLGPVTLSAGVAAFPMHGAAGEMVLATADAALYRAKRAGRDRVEVALSLETVNALEMV